MARFSLSSPSSSSILWKQQQQQQSSASANVATNAAPQWKWNFPPRKFPIDDDDDDVTEEDDADEVSSTLSSSAEDEEEDDNESQGIEPPHPLGFESRYGTTRFGLSPHYHYDANNVDSHRRQDIFDKDDEYAWNALIRIDDDIGDYRKQQQQSFVSSIRSYHLDNRGVASTKMLLRGMHPSHDSRGAVGEGDDETTIHELSMGMDRIANLVKAATYCGDRSEGASSLITPRPMHHHLQQPSPSTTSPPPRSTSRLLQLAMECERHQQSIANEMSHLQSSHEQSYQQSCKGFLLLLQAESERVKLASERIAQRQEQTRKLEEMGRLEREAMEKQMQEQAREQERLELERIAAEEERTQADQQKEQHRLELLAIAEQEAEKEAAAKYQHVSRAQDLIMHLDTVRSGGLAEFDKSTMVSKRRLQFKKIVNGKINTLAHDAGKILEVSRLVCDAVSNAAKDDVAAGGSGGDGVMTMGKKYLLDLLCSNLIVRVQADGFNGTRGDGFPLAGMFAQVSVHCEEIGPVLEGHLYTVCPTAIPTLSLDKDGGGGKGKDDENNDNLMESLGMIRDKDGEFESFDNFLHRTEGLISIMANIMSSLPANHTLLGGHAGALLWLQRFMDLLPPSPASPLPLLTAPVLVAFLTGAGHMLANKYPSEFTPLLTMMKDDLMHRLDESAIGVPSATRLKKVLEDIGLEGLGRDLPQGAVTGLYNVNEGSGGGLDSHSQALSSSFSSFGQKPLGAVRSETDGSNLSFSSSAWGNSGSSTDVAFDVSSSPFTAPVDNNNMSEEVLATSPFGGGLFGSSTASSATPFGGQASLFGTIPAAAPTPSPFGGGSVKSSGFGATSSAAPSPFTSFPATTGSSPFGMAATVNPSPFGATTAISSSTAFGSAPSPAAAAFGTSAPSTSPFGMGAAAPSPSPFGIGTAAPSPSPFGMGAAAPSPSPFGTTSTSFGAAPVPTPFSSAFGSSPFGGTSSSAPGPSPFSMNTGGQGFGQSGGGGDTTKQPCKFFASGTCNFGDRCKYSHELGAGQSGGGSNVSPFGVSSGQPTNTFGGGGKKPPCKFFASGSCRNGKSCPFSHEISGGGGVASGFGSGTTSFGGGGFGQSNPSPFSGGANSGGGFGNFGVAASPSPFSASSGSSNPFGGPRR